MHKVTHAKLPVAVQLGLLNPRNPRTYVLNRLGVCEELLAFLGLHMIFQNILYFRARRSKLCGGSGIGVGAGRESCCLICMGCRVYKS